MRKAHHSTSGESCLNIQLVSFRAQPLARGQVINMSLDILNSLSIQEESINEIVTIFLLKERACPFHAQNHVCCRNMKVHFFARSVNHAKNIISLIVDSC